MWGDGLEGDQCSRQKSDANQYQEQALANGLIPFLNNHNGNMNFMHDDAKPHTSRTTTAWLAAHRVQSRRTWTQLKIVGVNFPEEFVSGYSSMVCHTTQMTCLIWYKTSGSTWTRLTSDAWCCPCGGDATRCLTLTVATPSIDLVNKWNKL